MKTNQLVKKKTLWKIIDPAMIRTWNPLIRSQMPYPLGHGAVHNVQGMFILCYQWPFSRLTFFICFNRRTIQDRLLGNVDRYTHAMFKVCKSGLRTTEN